METVSTNFPRDASLFLLSFQEGAPLPMPFPAIWRSPTSPPSRLPLPAPALPSLSLPSLLGLSGSMAWGALAAPTPLLRAIPRVSPERREAKQPQTRGEVGVGAPSPGDASMAPIGARGCADLSIYLPRRLLPPHPGNPGLYLRRRCFGGVCVSYSPGVLSRSVAVSVFPLELALRLRRSSSRLGPSRRRPAPRSTPPQGPPPAS